MTKSERTRQYIIETTAPLFNCKGFDGTSLSDLTQTTGLTKGAIYGNFNDKDEIATEAFRYAIGKVREAVQERLSKVKTNKGQLVALFEFYSEYVFDPPVPGGCPLLNASVEVDDYHQSMRRIVVKELTQTVEFIRTLLEKGVEEGEFKKSIKVRELAYTFFCIVEGAIMYSRVERSREPMDIVIKHCKNILKNISK